jgi:hypothetical protein
LPSRLRRCIAVVAMWDLTSDQIDERKATLRARRAKLMDKIKAIDADLARVETLEREIAAFLRNNEGDDEFDIELGDLDEVDAEEIDLEENIPRYISGTDAIMRVLTSDKGLTRSDIIRFVAARFKKSLKRTTVSTYLNRLSQEGLAGYRDGRWYAYEAKPRI